jgi:hypothetical protein
MTRTLLGTVSVDWRTLLVLLAPQFVTPRKNIVASLLSAALKEKKFLPAPREHIDIFSTDLETIQAQLQAYGFIARETGILAKEGRFQLTPLGQRRYLEWATIKAPQEDS